MRNHMHTSQGTVAEAQQDSNLVILRFSPPARSRKRSNTTSALGMSIMIYRIGVVAPAQT